MNRSKVARWQRELANWKRHNPYILVNVASIGTQCGRFPTLASAIAETEKRGADYLDVRQCGEHTEVLFRAPVIL